MLILYTKPNCQYCEKVKREGEVLGVSFTEKSVLDEGIVDELVTHGGKRQVPYLIDEEMDTSFYGSDKIIEHLHQSFK